ncbi:MAG: LON peptidase substrate-binding domain-containing protein [Deltaproteobacteria bacterium]|nr:LON peptidase substrate-binding domain-containing protein [Deltaproteobacteria bacterium]
MDFTWLKNLLATGKQEANPPGMNRAEEVCVFPLPNVVLIPGNILPLHIFEERYKQMTEDLLQSNISLAMSLTVPSAQGKMKNSAICGGGTVRVMDEFPDGRKNIFVEGLKRLKIVKYVQESPYLKALAETIPDIPFASPAEEKKYLVELGQQTKRWIFLSRDLPDRYIPYVDLFTKPHLLADVIGFHFLPGSSEKQKLLETTDQKKRVEKIIFFVEGNIRRLEGIGSKALGAGALGAGAPGAGAMDDLKSDGKILH